jgi:phosphoribosylanthranilate isomerase
MRIKVCGITRYEDARVAASLGVDALGFIFYSKSPRCISPTDAAEIIRRLPPFVSRVGVFVDERPQRIAEIAELTGIDTIQLHGGESPEFCAEMPLPVIKVFSVCDGFDAACINAYKTAGHLLDTWDPERRGGSGRTFDWAEAVKACRICDTVILAGGLGPTNIKEAICAVGPYAVDVNSGVESGPGIKNPYKIREVVSIVKNHKHT